MIIKRYVVDNMNEAMVKIRYELGSDAVIVSQRKIRQKGIAGFLKAKKIEVTAAVDDKAKKQKEAFVKNNEIQSELNELKSMIKDFVSQDNNERKRKSKGKTKKILVENDIPEDIVDKIYTNIQEKNENKKLSPKLFEKEIRNTLADMIRIDENLTGRVNVLVGPTGVGKTTTIAKLASTYTLYKNKKVGLITLDTYRIGAVEQLKTYAEILGVPFDVILSTKDIPEVMEKMKDRDIIFVDTTGRNSKNIMQISEIRKYIDELKADSVHLVISMTTKQKDIKKIIDNYKHLNYNSLILTKMDETDIFGSILTSVYHSNVPISYITTGQSVPEDIERAEKLKLIKLILGAEE